jgi:glycerol-3-phosphate dehydrogenase
MKAMVCCREAGAVLMRGSLASAWARIGAMQRKEALAALARPVTHDVAVIGGGATGLGVALDAAARGFKVVLLESHDFAKGTSSRATKLVHGGVRYLAQGNIALVREALHERTRCCATRRTWRSRCPS